MQDCASLQVFVSTLYRPVMTCLRAKTSTLPPTSTYCLFLLVWNLFPEFTARRFQGKRTGLPQQSWSIVCLIPQVHGRQQSPTKPSGFISVQLTRPLTKPTVHSLQFRVLQLGNRPSPTSRFQIPSGARRKHHTFQNATSHWSHGWGHIGGPIRSP